MRTLTIQLLKPAKSQVITFSAELLAQHDGEMMVRAKWEQPRRDLGYVMFETGDTFIEHYYTNRWYTIYAIHASNGMLKGWYCNAARPAAFDGVTITSEDLELDLFVSPDRQTLLTLDVDEFEARGFAQHEPETYASAFAAIAELEQMARAGSGPFAIIHKVHVAVSTKESE